MQVTNCKMSFPGLEPTTTALFAGKKYHIGSGTNSKTKLFTKHMVDLLGIEANKVLNIGRA